jgi:ABC-type transport system involved in cytochrome c biogenesis permease subunit
VRTLEILCLAAGILMYLLGTLAAAAAARSGDRRRLAQARLCGLLGAATHAVMLGSLGIRTGHFPVTSAFEAFVFLSAFTTLAALALDGLKGFSVLLVGVLPLALLTSAVAAALEAAPSPEAPPAPGVGSAWTALHISTALGAYCAFAVSFVCGILYLVAQRQLKEHQLPNILGLMPSLETVARLNVRSMAVGALLLAGGILVGYAQARSVYNRQFDRLDPKIILSTLTFLAYLAVLLLNRRPAFRGRRSALASVGGFFLVMATFWASLFWSDFHRFR